VLDNLPTPPALWASFYCKLKFELAVNADALNPLEPALAFLFERVFDVPVRTVALLLHLVDRLLARHSIFDESRNLLGDQHPLNQTQPGGGFPVSFGFKDIADKAKFVVGEWFTAALNANR
jgi:hypothetical protein